MTLFHMFWPVSLLMDIVEETNRYATTIDGEGRSPGGATWKELTVLELKVFLAITLYMGMKKQPNVKIYWMRAPSIFHCDVINKNMTRKRYIALTRCLHITNPAMYVTDRNLAGYDKMGQVRSMVDMVRGRFKAVWNLEKFLTIDEMMIRYKGTYCPAYQYMPKKPQKWGIKVWCLADSTLRYVYDIDIYCGRNGGNGNVPQARRGEPRLAHSIVMKLIEGNHGKGHCLVMDNYFTSVGLLEELAAHGTYGTGTVRFNRVGIPQDFKDTRDFNRVPQGTLA
jgi:hypothetical protein